MILNLNKYNHLKAKILSIHRNTPEKLVELCVASSIPLIVAYCFLNLEIGGFNKDIIRLIEFYDYDIKVEDFMK